MSNYKKFLQKDDLSLRDFMPDTSNGYIATAGSILQTQDNQIDEITMSLTAPGCPVAGEMPGEVARKVATLDNVGVVRVTLVWDPPWTPERMSEDAKLALDYSF